MRWIFAIISLTITGWSLVLNHYRPLPDSWPCRAGLCRYDQVFSAIDVRGPDLSNIAVLLNQDPSNPLVWCAYAELLFANGKMHTASAAFGDAVAAGPGMSPVLMRAANFEFASGRISQGLELTHQILMQTDVFDQVLFSYLTHTGLSISKLAGIAVPALPRAATAWFAWLRDSGSDQDLRELWSWMRKNNLLDQKSATDFVWAFWRRGAYRTAQDSWADWLGSSHTVYLHPQRLSNTRFEYVTNRSPFDWWLTQVGGANIVQNDGLDIRFPGTENVDLSTIRQFSTVSAGLYRFSAEISAKEITTDQGPFFHVFDAVDATRLSIESARIRGTVARSWMTMLIRVLPATEVLQVQVERRPSQKFDNKISGTLHVYRVSLLPVS